jgi:hypothetical protein
MSERTLTMILVVQTLLLGVLVLDRVMPVAHAADTMRCEIANWPDVFRGSSIPLKMQYWDTTDQVSLDMRGWSTSSRIRVETD